MTDETAPALEPLTCPQCAAPVAVVDADETSCAHCRASVVLPRAHRRALSLVRKVDRELDAAAELYRKFQRREVPRRLGIALMFVPALYAILGFSATALVAWGPLAGRVPVRVFFNVAVVVPLAVLSTACVYIYWHSLGGGFEPIRRSLAARFDRGVPNCRLCGAPLPTRPSALFARCIYCAADSLVVLDAARQRALSAQVGGVRDKARDMLEAFQVRDTKATAMTKGMGGLYAVLALATSMFHPFSAPATMFWMILVFIWPMQTYSVVAANMDVRRVAAGEAAAWMAQVHRERGEHGRLARLAHTWGVVAGAALGLALTGMYCALIYQLSRPPQAPWEASSEPASTAPPKRGRAPQSRPAAGGLRRP